MANVYKINANGGVRIPVLSADPGSPEDGTMWYNSTTGIFKKRENGATSEATPSEFSDSLFRIQDNADGTKEIAFEASAITTGTTRTISMPDTNVDLADIALNNAKRHDALTLDIDLDVTEQAANLVGQELELLKASASNDGVMSSEDKSKLDGIEASAKDDQSAAEVPFTPAGNIAASQVQAAIEELDSEKASSANLASTANALGASLIGIEDSALQFTATNVEAALAESLDAAQAAQADIDGHQDGGASKHDASEIDYEQADASKLSILDASDAVEAALSDLDSKKSAVLSARAVAVSNVDIANAPGTLDGVTLSNQDYVLLTAQTAPAANGLYVFTSGAPNTLARATEMSKASQFVVGGMISVREGTSYSDSFWVNQAVVATLGTTAVDIDVVGDPALTAHLDGGISKHDASEIDYERVDGSKKNIQAASDAVESALTDLDDAIGALDATPTNYTPTDPSIVSDHLQAIDSALATSGSPEFSDSLFRINDNIDATKQIAFEATGIATATTRTITMPNANVALGDIATNSAHSSGDGSDHQDVADLATLSGVAANSVNLGIFTGTTIPDSQTIKQSLQALETSVETKAASSVVTEIDANVDDLITLSGVAENSTSLGTFTGTTIPDSSTVKAALQSLETSLEAIPDAMEYKGNWAASTNTPTLADGVGNNGDVYFVTDAGSVNFGSGAISFNQGDRVVYSGADAKWQKWDTTDQVSSVNSQTGAVILDADDIDDSATTNKFATAAQLAKVDFISITQAVDLDAVESTANSALQAVSDDTAPSLGGNLTLGANVLIHDANGVKKGSSATDFYEEEYIHASTLAANITAVAADFTFAHASFEGMLVEYKMKQATTNRVRVGSLMVATDGTNASITDTASETGDVQISWSAAVNGANLELSYTNANATNAVTMRSVVKRIKV